MYILSGKGSVAGVDLATYILETCQKRGVLWDDDLPQYTLDFLTQTPSVSKSIREGTHGNVVAVYDEKLKWAAKSHNSYMLLCLTAHRLIPELRTDLACINLWDAAMRKMGRDGSTFAFLGTRECLPPGFEQFALLPDHGEQIGDLITSVKRGYARLGEGYAAHPRHLLRRIFDHYNGKGIRKFFLACTDLHACKRDLMDFGVNEDDIVDIVEVAGDEVMVRHARARAGAEALADAVSDAKTLFRYKYVSASDSLQTDDKTRHLHALLEGLPDTPGHRNRILDIGGSSTGHPIALARRFPGRHFEVTVQDISQASLDAAREVYAGADNITAKFSCGNVADFDAGEQFDFILCLGVLLYISSDEAFQRVISTIARITAPGGYLITRDCLSRENRKIHMDFGGVIRNEDAYGRAFSAEGFSLVSSSEFVADHAIRRIIRTALWRKAGADGPLSGAEEARGGNAQ